MTDFAFEIGGVSASALGATASGKFGHFAVRVGGNLSSICQVTKDGDDSFGALENKILHYGSMQCHTTLGGERMGADPEGRAFPELLLFKYIEIKVDCGRIAAGEARVMVDLEICEGLGQVKGPTLYKVEHRMMRVWSGTMSSDAEINGYARPFSGSADDYASRLFNGTTLSP